MTQTPSQQTSTDADDARQPISAGRTTVIVAGSLALALGIAAVIAIPITAAVASTQVISYQDAQSLVCSDQEPGTVPEAGDEFDETSQHYRSMVLTPDLDCQLRFYVTNNSMLPVVVTGADLDLAGPGSANGILATSIDGEPFDRPENELDSDRDAVVRFEAAHALEPGETRPYSVQFEFNPDGACVQEDIGYIAIVNAPGISVSVLGIEGHRDGLPGGYAVTGAPGSMSGCT